MECDIETNYLLLPFIKLIGILSPTLVEIEQLKSFDADTPRNALDVFKTEFCTRKFISTRILKVRGVGDVYCRFLRRLNIWANIKGRYHHIIWGRLCRKHQYCWKNPFYWILSKPGNWWRVVMSVHTYVQFSATCIKNTCPLYHSESSSIGKNASAANWRCEKNYFH